jgi:acyl carrier protein
MTTEEIRQRVKRVIHQVTNVPIDSIADHASFVEDLELDSLALLEVGVDVDYEFQLGIEDLEDRLGEMPTVDHVARFVQAELERRAS